MRFFKQPLHNLSYHVRMRAFLFLLAFTAYAQDACEVHFRFVLLSGALAPHKVTMFRGSHGKDETTKFQDGHAAVPCGTYFYEDRPNDASENRALFLTGEIKLTRSITALTRIIPSGIAVSRSGGLDKPYQGLVMGAGAAGADWYVIASLLEDKRAEGPVRPDGSFQVFEAIEGIVTATFFRKGAILDSQARFFDSGAFQIPSVPPVHLNPSAPCAPVLP
jgi:hypothetical protein